MKRKTTDEFIEDAKRIHQDTYDYSKVAYINNQTKIIIICKVHGQFLQAPSHHLLGKNCALCKGNKKKTTQEFIEDSKKIHKDTYDYSKVKYINNQTKVIITCLEHGDFLQCPSSHIYKKSGCPICATKHRINKVKKTQEEFIEQANTIHKNKYIYSKVEYINSLKKVTILCKIHGAFFQNPSNHLEGKGCRKCSINKLATNKRKTKEKFIKEANNIHKNLYDYSKIKYKNNKIKINIICKKHGSFWQIPVHHLKGSGCPNCACSRFNTNKPAILYYLKITTDKSPLYKIGVSNYTVKKRFCNNDLKNITILKTFTYILGKDALEEEKRILTKFKTYKYKGNKILDSGGNSELFTKDILDLDKNS